METTTNPTPAFSFATENEWRGYDVDTMRLHSRARLIQSQLRANRLRRQNLALRHLLVVAQAHRRVEKRAIERDPQVIDLRDRRDRKADANREVARKETRRIIEQRDRDALLDLRRQHEAAIRAQLSEDATIDLRAPFPIPNGAQPRSAVAHRRWG